MKGIIYMVIAICLVSMVTAEINKVIYTCEGLQAINEHLTWNYSLGANIDCSDTVNWNGGEGFEPIGAVTTRFPPGEPIIQYPFIGTFEGNNYSINNIYINYSDRQCGLFEFVLLSTINDLELRNANVICQNKAGGILAGLADSTHFNNIHIINSNISATTAGGILGIARNNFEDSINYSNITNSFFLGNVVGVGFSGGLIGSSTGYSIIESFSEGTITGNERIGGIAARLIEAEVVNSYSKMNLTSTNGGTTDGVGGLIGVGVIGNLNKSYYYGQIVIANVFNPAGGLVGFTQRFNISNSFSIPIITDLSRYNGSIVGRLNQDSDSFISFLNNNYWNNITINPNHCYTNYSGRIGFNEINNPGNIGCIAIQDNEAYFNTITNAPMDTWDFANVWDNSNDGNGLPTLLWENSLNKHIVWKHKNFIPSGQIKHTNGNFVPSGQLKHINRDLTPQSFWSDMP